MANRMNKNPNMSDISSFSSKKKKKKKSVHVRRIKKVLSAIGKIVASFILILAITGSIVVTALTVYVTRFAEPNNDIDIKDAALGYTTQLIATDKDGNETIRATVHNSIVREWVDLERVPQIVRMAFVCSEDKRFYDHDGVDWQRTFSAFANLFLHFYSTQQGGSTITQQLIKNITGENDVKISRKFNEIFRAVNLEKIYSKDEILESYLNLIPLDQSIHGIQAASKYYFNKDVSQLSVVEAAALAAMVKAPRTFNPILYPEENKERRNNYVLPAMCEEGVITEAELEIYKNTPLVTAADPQKPRKETEPGYSWFTETVLEEVKKDLIAEKGWSSDYAEEQLASGGLRIYTTEDIDLQTHLEECYLNTANFSASTNEDILCQSAMVIMDYSGNVKAVVGARGEKEGDRIWNNATMSARSPGSSIKPLAAYGPAIESNLINYSSMLVDEPVPTELGGVIRRDWPHNYDHVYRGGILMPEAIQRSTNTIPVKIVNMLTPQYSFSFLADRLHISSLSEYDVATPRLALGGLYTGVYVEEWTAAYQIFGNQGLYHNPHTYTKILDSSGEVVLEKEVQEVRVLSPESASIMNRLLQNVVEGPNGTATRARISGWTIVGKSGTATNDSGGTTDQWFVGCSPYYVAGIWIGYPDSNKTVPSGLMYSPPQVWSTIMRPVLNELEPIPFEYSPNIVTRAYCTETGLLAKSNCPHKATGYYKPTNIPNYCTMHDEKPLP